MIDADIKAGVADATSRYLLIQDNLDAQCKSRNPEYISYLDTHCRTDDRKVSSAPSSCLSGVLTSPHIYPYLPRRCHLTRRIKCSPLTVAWVRT